jgi:hypothetical protein
MMLIQIFLNFFYICFLQNEFRIEMNPNMNKLFKKDILIWNKQINKVFNSPNDSVAQVNLKWLSDSLLVDKELKISTKIFHRYDDIQMSGSKFIHEQLLSWYRNNKNKIKIHITPIALDSVLTRENINSEQECNLFGKCTLAYVQDKKTISSDTILIAFKHYPFRSKASSYPKLISMSLLEEYIQSLRDSILIHKDYTYLSTPIEMRRDSFINFLNHPDSTKSKTLQTNMYQEWIKSCFIPHTGIIQIHENTKDTTIMAHHFIGKTNQLDSSHYHFDSMDICILNDAQYNEGIWTASTQYFIGVSSVKDGKPNTKMLRQTQLKFPQYIKGGQYIYKLYITKNN